MTMIADNRILIVLVVLMALILVWWLWGRRLAVPTEKPDATLDKIPPVKTVAVEAPVKADIKPTTKKVIVSKAKAATKIKAVAKPVTKTPAPKKPAAAKRVKPEPSAPDNLLQLKGVGPKLVVLLDGLGVHQFSQIAAWTAEDVARVDAQLGNFAGRIVRDSWIEQAGFLASGNISAFEAKFGKLDSENS